MRPEGRKPLWKLASEGTNLLYGDLENSRSNNGVNGAGNIESGIITGSSADLF